MFPNIGLVFLLVWTIVPDLSPSQAAELETYIVQLEKDQGRELSRPEDLDEWYDAFLSEVSSGPDEKPTMVYKYSTVFTGFSAKLSVNHAKAMENMTGVVSVRRESVFELQTTRTPQFLGLSSSRFWKSSNYGKGIIIGLLDSGITPGHPSFHDKGVPPPPARWKGSCTVAGCNNKLIGMRNYFKGSENFDVIGHGTHTASTATGNFVRKANVWGNADGTAAGMAPLAHVAMYKICYRDLGCFESSVIKGMDDAVKDGVDVISISLKVISSAFYNNTIAITTYTAVQRGIFVSCCAGNSGPHEASLVNEAPWTLTVGASTIDRRLRTRVRLGDNQSFDGESIYQPAEFDERRTYALVYPGKNGDHRLASCSDGSLDHIDVKGKVVLCDVGVLLDNIERGEEVKRAGGAAMIITNTVIEGETTLADIHVLPASNVGYKAGVRIKKYINSTSTPTATILFMGTVLGIKSAPEVSFFSSRGPSNVCPGILKPDIIGPGVNILAGWPKSVDNKTRTKATFNIISGTSMSCPHLAGVAALLKSAHPDWSPAAIKSAIMTTASQVRLDGKAIVDQRDLPADVFSIGAGHVNPSKASDPGLVFDLEPDHYIPYLCGLYQAKQVEVIVKKKVSCKKPIPEAQLNYPSFAISLKSGESKTYTRTATNVGPTNSSYSLGDVSLPAGVHMKVSSHTPGLTFTSVNQKITYKVTFTRDSKVNVIGRYGQGFMTWISGKHSVRIPISIRFDLD